MPTLFNLEKQPGLLL